MKISANFGFCFVGLFFECLLSVAHADCTAPAEETILQVPLNGHPFSAVPSADGCTIFVSLTGAKSGLAVLKRENGSVTVEHVIQAEGQLTGMAISPDGNYIAAANGAGATIFDTSKLLAGAENAAMGYLNDRAGAGSIYTAFTPDQHLLFVSDERDHSITVYDFVGIFAGRGIKPVGEIHTGDAPVGLAVSPDGKLLYSTSEVSGPAGNCRENGERGHGPGELVVIDVSKAAINPAASVLGRVPAGCSPVRVALSPNGDTVYVSARGQNTVMIFDAAKLINNPHYALTAQIKVGDSPVGVAVTKESIFVTNSNRFGAGTNQSVSMFNTEKLDAGAQLIPAGVFPRELKLTPDGNTLLITNFGSETLELVNLTKVTAISVPK